MEHFRSLLGRRIIFIDGYSGFNNKYGRILNIFKRNNGFVTYLIEFDNNISGHDGSGDGIFGETKGRYGHCWWCEENNIKFINNFLRIN